MNESDMLMLKGHTALVLVGAWTSKNSIPTTTSTDSTVIGWTIKRIYNTQSTAEAANASNYLFLEQ